MDPSLVPIMAGNVVALALIVGGILMYPTTKRFGTYLDMLIEERRRKSLPAPKDLEEMEAELLRTQEELAQLRERQEFVEALLTGTRTPPELAAPAANATEREQV
ncbi:MAG TPA: hypothetical protein VGB15_13335 [Longimicrobium sp.]|jgi:CRISPR/Cas system Type II protein with McrA/HNH and RuvC-like nuclease domain